ncbi:MAG: hypothetical protein H6898_09565 [Rhodobacter sp.]|nr:hypothetical protein [Paracoccaceae bacterium]MCC0076817.1 hypothetical protein [Rhodobacter sp.]
MTTRSFQALALALMLAGVALLAGLIVARAGLLVYTLDDPYIHLALAEELLRGNYGINPGEHASPSSSMLYAPLLAPLLALGLGGWAPLVLALAGQALAIWLLAGIAAPLLARHGVGLATLAAALLVLAVNGYALPLTGMEHPLHVAASLAVVLGVWRAAQGAAPGWLVPAILLAALIRFEGYALALAAIGVLAMLRHWRVAGTALAGLVALTLAYGAAMAALGLPPLPSSVMVKSQASAAAADAALGDALVAVIVNGVRALSHRWGVIFALGLAGFAVAALRPGAPREGRAVAVLGIAVLGAHLLVGRYGWFGRYEVYATAVLLAVALLLLPRGRAVAWGAALALAVIGWAYVPVTLQTPAAALSIHQQHHQMHRFATEFFPYPVAVNDLGYVAWRNDMPVLDLWGLGSEDARRLTATQGRTVETLRALTAGRVGWAMVYDIAFAGAIPPEWCRIAALTTSRVIAASDTVAFYRIDPALDAGMRAALTDFAPTLPEGAQLTIFPCPE